MIWNDVFCIPPIQVCDKQSIDLFHLEYKFAYTAVQTTGGGNTFLQWSKTIYCKPIKALKSQVHLDEHSKY
jgi:hypothetical protein